MPLDFPRCRPLLQTADLGRLFIEQLGWDHCAQSFTVKIDKRDYQLTAIAKKCGLVAYLCDTTEDATRRLDFPNALGQSRRMNHYPGCLCAIIAFGLLNSLTTRAEGPKASSGSSLPPIQTAGSDERGRITVNGKPFFPILMYDVPTDPGSLKMFREHGFNTLTAGKPEDADLLLANGLYAAVHAGHKAAKLDGVLFAIGMDSPAMYWKDNLLGKAKADLAKIRLEIPNRPVMHAIGYWADEPGGVVSNTILPPAQYDELIRAIDVAAPYLYPVPYQPVRSVGEAVRRASAATQGRKPVLPVLQLFVWEPKDRYPTPAELRCMVYLSLMHGADGIGYYSYKTITGKKDTNIAKEQPELWKAVRQINSEAAAIATLLSDSMLDPFTKLKESDPEVEFRAVAKGSLQVILLANSSAAEKRVTLQLASKPKISLKRLAGGDEVAVKDGQAKLKLEPFEAVALIY